MVGLTIDGATPSQMTPYQDSSWKVTDQALARLNIPCLTPKHKSTLNWSIEFSAPNTQFGRSVQAENWQRQAVNPPYVGWKGKSWEFHTVTTQAAMETYTRQLATHVTVLASTLSFFLLTQQLQCLSLDGSACSCSVAKRWLVCFS